MSTPYHSKDKMLKKASVSKKCVSLHRDLGDNKSWQNAYRISSFSRKSPVFDLTEGQMPMLFAYMCCNGTSIGIRHIGDVPSLLRSLAIPLLRRRAESDDLCLCLNNNIKKQFIMPQLINYGKEMLRISTKGIDYSTNGGRSWNMRFSGSAYGTFIDLLPYGNELLAVTTKGIYHSSNEGRSWNLRYSGSSYGEFQSLTDNGRELLANTSKGLFYSTNSGRSWNRK